MATSSEITSPCPDFRPGDSDNRRRTQQKKRNHRRELSIFNMFQKNDGSKYQLFPMVKGFLVICLLFSCGHFDHPGNYYFSDSLLHNGSLEEVNSNFPSISLFRGTLVSAFSMPSSVQFAQSRAIFINSLKGASSHLMVANPSSSSDIDAKTRTRNSTPKKSSSKSKIKSKSISKHANNYKRKTRTKSFNNYMSPASIAARNFNKDLIQCTSAKELLSSFMDQTTKSSATPSAENDAPAMSSATHLAGAGKLNSVNFSTCLHRLARFAAYTPQYNHHRNNQYQSNNNINRNNNNNNNDDDAIDGEEQRKQVLNDPRFALLVCSMAEMAAGAHPTITVGDARSILDQWEKMNQEDEFFRLEMARKCMGQLAVGSGKSYLDDGNYCFSSRECSNVCWALAKLRLSPPLTAFPLGRVRREVGGFDGFEDEGFFYSNGAGFLGDDSDVEDGHDPLFNDHSSSSKAQRQFVSMEEMALDVISSCLEVRMKLLEEARKRRTSGEGSVGGWIPELSRLAAKILDLIAVQAIDEYRARESQANRSEDGNKGGNTGFNPQEMANVLYSFAKAKRGDPALFSAVADGLMRETHDEIAKGGQGPKPQELSNSIWAFATAGIRCNTQVKLVKFMADALDEGNGQFYGFDFKPQELSNTAWALATLHSRRSSIHNHNAGNRNSDAIEDDGIVRILRWVARAITKRTKDFKPQELSNSVWAFSTIGFGYDETSGTNAHNDYIHVMSDAPMEDKELVFETLETVADNALPRLGRFKAQELNNLAWGYARLGHRTERSEALLRGVGDELKRRCWQFKPQDVGTTLWSFATAEYFDYDTFCAGASRLNFQHIRSFKPQEMSNTLWALATAGFSPAHIRAFDTTLVPASQRPSMSDITSDPITECFAAVAAEAMRRPHDFKDQELKDVIWSFSKSGVRHPALFKKVAEHLVGNKDSDAKTKQDAISSGARGFFSFSSQGLGNTLWSFAKQAQLSQDVIEDLGDSVKVGSTGRLAVYETSCLDIGEDLVKRVFARAAESGMDKTLGGLERFKNQDISNTVWAFATLGLLHSEFFEETERQIISRINARANQATRVFKAQEVANLLWSMATLNVQPGTEMIDAISAYIASECQGKNGFDEYSIARIFKRQELTNIAWSCAVLGRYPKQLMDIVYTGIFGTKNDPEQMKQIFNDDGLQKSSIMTFYYVQVAADIEAPHLRLSLPIGFPNGWGEDDEEQDKPISSKNDETTDELVQISSSMLTLSTSKLQRDVSDIFTEIGFDNVLEHVIDTNVIKDEYGVHLPPSPQEFLSIDIANIDSRIGIEVDGPAHFVQIIDSGNEAIKSLPVSGKQLADRGDNRVNGPTTLKHRLLTHLGWNIIHLPYWEFQGLGGDREQEMMYCQSLLEDCS